jgi:hypothetical protein
MTPRLRPLALALAALGTTAAPALAVPVIDECRCTATVFVRAPDGTLTTEPRTVLVTDTGGPFPPAPSDTCPAGARIDVLWHAEPPNATGYRYRLDESDWIVVGPEVTSATYFSGTPPDTTPPAPGTKFFRLQEVSEDPFAPTIARRFQLGFRPDSWVAGPDPGVSVGPWVTRPDGVKYALLVGGMIPPGGLPGTLLSPDSVNILPFDRPPHRTFLEIYADTVYLRHEFDTVHKGSWVVFHGGGFDSDSRYRVRVADGIEEMMPLFPGGPVLTPGPANGSPVGFRSIIPTFLTPDGPLVQPAQSGIYPLFDPNSVFHLPRIGMYHPMSMSGTAYAVQRAEDGDGARDNRIALGAERTVGEDPMHPLRAQVMVFDVDLPPVLRTEIPIFRPSVTQVDTFSSRTWDLHLPATNPDPFVPGSPFGGPYGSSALRMRFRVTGVDWMSLPIVYRDPAPEDLQTRYVNVTDVTLTVPDALASGPATLSIELCDCTFCEDVPGSGRCITRDIPVYFQAPPVAGAGPSATPTALRAPLGGSGGGDITVRFDLGTQGHADLDVFDVAGQRVRRLVSGWFPAGPQTSLWDRRDAQGAELRSGVYFLRLRAPDATLTRKFFVAR